MSMRYPCEISELNLRIMVSTQPAYLVAQPVGMNVPIGYILSLETIRRFPGKLGVKLCMLITAEFYIAETFY